MSDPLKIARHAKADFIEGLMLASEDYDLAGRILLAWYELHPKTFQHRLKRARSMAEKSEVAGAT